MRFRFKAPGHHVLYFGPEDDPILKVHGGEEYDHPEGFGIPRNSEPVDEDAQTAVEASASTPEPLASSASAESTPDPSDKSDPSEGLAETESKPTGSEDDAGESKWWGGKDQ